MTTDRHLCSMSALSGLLALRSYLAAHQSVYCEDAITALKRVSPDDGYHDYDSALILHGWISSTVGHSEVPPFFRHTLLTIIEHTKPWWRRLFVLGRDRVKAALDANEIQCFDAAGLFSEHPSSDIREWWDALQESARSESDAKRLQQGRRAEKLTLDHEIKRLSELGISNQPRWIALDDNTAGYDIHSFDKGPAEPIARLIEVKSCSRMPKEIFLTRNEWETAIQMAPNYRFHIWTLPEEHLIELTTRDIERHVPSDQGSGTWQITKISLSADV